MEDLKGKVSIITGGAMGIGKEVALRLARDGSHIVVVDMDEDAAQGTIEDIEALGRQALFCRVDVSDWNQVKTMVDQTLETFQRVDILVCSAGITGPLNAPVHTYDLEEWNRVVAVNMTGIFLCCKAVLAPMLEQQSGRIVNIASIAAKDGNPGMCGYVASKGAVIAFTKGLAKEVVQDGIIVNCIAPTVIESRFLEIMGAEVQETLLAKIPMGRFGKTSEVAALVKFLVSDECSFSTGFCHDISGGRAVY
jgi:NAD(P)-dependent dehydrogenase (short-subunit alcohol dehydrogenase family)